MRLVPRFIFFLILTLLASLPAARADEVARAAADIAAADFAGKLAAVDALAATGDPRAATVLDALQKGALHTRKADGLLVIATGGREPELTDPLTGTSLGTASSRDLARVTANNALRNAAAAALARLGIASTDPAVRRSAAERLAGEADPAAIPLLSGALESETDGGIRGLLEVALAKASLASPDAGARLSAIGTLGARPTPAVRALVLPLAGNDPSPEVRAAAGDLVASIDRRQGFLNAALNLFQGISLGSVLLLAAAGLAVTFGVMGVINMAHGEMIMIGAYTTVIVQEAFRSYLPPGLFGLYLPVAVPAAFLVAGAVGVALERGVIRFLYGRPLETLLATWGISLILQQVVRTLFGAPNREVANPSWMTGGVEVVSGMMLTWNRIYIILFAFAVLGGLGLLMRYTRFGLSMRAVTQNRSMASSMGIRTGWVDALTFGVGSGIAGMAGVALSQIGNVSPNLGQAYIVDSFMVVVFGGVGSLWGVLAGALGLGVVNKLLEPYAGAMLGKILVLVFIILFIQKRPRGLFALKGRSAEA
jgi:urea transport system permease protein